MAPESDGIVALKTAWRHKILAARTGLSADHLAYASRQTAAWVAATSEWRSASTVALYLSMPSEPSTLEIVAMSLARGQRVLAPMLRPDADLDWAQLDDQGAVVLRRGVREPVGRQLGVAAISEADLVLVPGLSVDMAGGRLGRGGGSYDRALLRVRRGVPVWMVCFEDEIFEAGRVPRQPHDTLVTGAACSSGVLRFTPADS